MEKNNKYELNNNNFESRAEALKAFSIGLYEWLIGIKDENEIRVNILAVNKDGTKYNKEFNLLPIEEKKPFEPVGAHHLKDASGVHMFLNDVITIDGENRSLLDFADYNEFEEFLKTLDFSTQNIDYHGSLPAEFIRSDSHLHPIFFELRDKDVECWASQAERKSQTGEFYTDDFENMFSTWIDEVRGSYDTEYNCDYYLNNCLDSFIGKEDDGWEDLKEYDDYNDDYYETPSSVKPHVDWDEYFKEEYSGSIVFEGGYIYSKH